MTAKGPAIMMVSALMFAVLGFLIKIMGPSFRVWDIAVYRFGGSAVLLWIIFGWRENLFRSPNQKLMLMRGVAGSIAFIAIIYAIRSIPLSTAMVIFYSFPAFAAAFSPFFFGDRISKTEITCIMIALFGVSVLFNFRLEGMAVGQAMALIGAVFAALTVTFIKQLRETHGSVIIYFQFCLVGAAVSLVPFAAEPHLPHTTIDWLLIAGMIAVSVLAQLLMHHGFRYCRSWEGGLLMTSELIYASIFGIIFLSEPATWRFWVGGLMIISSAVILNLANHNNKIKIPIPSAES
jgi:drug/metabolite transporter (DMT)-like permease